VKREDEERRQVKKGARTTEMPVQAVEPPSGNVLRQAEKLCPGYGRL